MEEQPVLYSGFTYPSQESYYFKAAEKTVKLIIDKLISLLQHRSFNFTEDRKWAMKVRKGYKALVLMERQKTEGPWVSGWIKLLSFVLKSQFVDSIPEGDSSQESDEIGRDKKMKDDGSELSLQMVNLVTYEPVVDDVPKRPKPA